MIAQMSTQKGLTEREMDSEWGKKEVHTEFWLRNSMERYHFGYLGINGRVTLKMDLGETRCEYITLTEWLAIGISVTSVQLRYHTVPCMRAGTSGRTSLFVNCKESLLKKKSVPY